MAWAAEAGIEIRRRPKTLKTLVRENLLRDLKSGMDKKAAAEKHGVSIQAITRLLQTEIGLHQSWSSARLERERTSARQKWLAAVAEVGALGTKIVRSLEPAAYAWLYRNDREWLKAHVPGSVKRVGNHSSVNWDKRDLGLAQEVEKVALVLWSGPGRKRHHLWELCQLIPELRAKLGTLCRLPITKRTIRNVLAKPPQEVQEADLF
jgi:hypothetical protein